MFSWYRRFRDFLNNPVVAGLAYGVCVGAGTIAATAPPGPQQALAALVAGICGGIGISAKPGGTRAQNDAVPPS